MADELKRVGLVFKADGAADFQKTMQQVNTAVQENSNSFKLAKAAWDDSTTAVEKLKDRQEYLAKQTDVYSDKVEILKRELEEMESAENRNEDAIRKKQNQLTSAQISLTKYQKGLAEVTEELESGAAESKEQIRKNLTIDTGRKLAYREDGTLSNTSVTGDYDNLILIEGRNKIEITDGFELKVIPNWRRL